MNHAHTLWLTLTNLSLGLVMLGAAVALGASWLRRGNEGAAIAKMPTPKVIRPAAEPSSATGT